MNSILTYNDPDIAWYSPGKYLTFRENGPSFITLDGRVYFSQIDSTTNNRKRGPAIICPTGEIVYQSSTGGELHRTDGPARIWTSGDKEYWVNDKFLTPEEFFMKYGVL